MFTTITIKKFNWKLNVPFLLLHLSCFLVFLWPIEAKWIALCLGLYVVRMFAITAGYHRYFSHKTYKTSRFFQFFLAFLGCLAFQKGPLWWSAHHRHHHRFTAQKEDLHSPEQFGFWRSHIGWIFDPASDATHYDRIRDLTKYPELMFLDNYHLLPGILLGMVLVLTGGWSALVWGLSVSTILCTHATFTINSLSHIFGTRRYATTDDSRNHWFLAILTMGEGWHNNHHHYPHSTRQGFAWYEYDASYAILKVLSWLGIVWDLKAPPADILNVEKKVAAAESLPLAA